METFISKKLLDCDVEIDFVKSIKTRGKRIHIYIAISISTLD